MQGLTEQNQPYARKVSDHLKFIHATEEEITNVRIFLHEHIYFIWILDEVQESTVTASDEYLEKQ